MSAVRTIFGPALLAMGLVAGIAYLFSLGHKDEDLDAAPTPVAAPAAPPPEPAEPPPEPAEPVAALPEAPPAPAEPAPVAPQPSSKYPPLATKSLPDVSVKNPPPLEPRLKTHAMQMVTPALKLALDRGEVKQLRTLRAFLEQRKAEQLLPDVDMQALDAAIACLEEAPEARQEATDFLKFGMKSQFADGLRKVCF